jgi:hypothetical protein
MSKIAFSVRSAGIETSVGMGLSLADNCRSCYGQGNCTKPRGALASAAPLTRELPDVDRPMPGADYPHSEGKFLHSREQVAKDFARIPASEECSMVVGNAARLYELQF